jgi:hypothetical protein
MGIKPGFMIEWNIEGEKIIVTRVVKWRAKPGTAPWIPSTKVWPNYPALSS